MTNLDQRHSTRTSYFASERSTEDVSRSRAPQLIKFEGRGPGGSVGRMTPVEPDLNDMRKSISMGATVLKDLANHSRTQVEAAGKAIKTLEAELEEERGRYKTLKSRLDAAEEHHRRALSAAEQKVRELQATNKTITEELQAKTRELGQLRWFLEGLVSDVEAIEEAVQEAGEILAGRRLAAD